MAKTNKTKIPEHLEEQLCNAFATDENVNSRQSPIEKTCKKNTTLEQNLENSQTEKTYIQLFSHPTLRLYSIIMFPNWVLVTLGIP